MLLSALPWEPGATTEAMVAGSPYGIFQRVCGEVGGRDALSRRGEYGNRGRLLESVVVSPAQQRPSKTSTRNHAPRHVQTLAGGTLSA